MTEQQGNDKYIKCSSCKCKYINDDEHIKTDFGYNRLNERFKTCVTCREKGKQKLAEQILSDDLKRCSRCRSVRTVTEYGVYNGVVVIDGKCCNQQLTYKTCSGCRNDYKRRVY